MGNSQLSGRRARMCVIGALASIGMLGPMAPVFAGNAAPPSGLRPCEWSSGPFANDTTGFQVVFTTIVDAGPDAAWVRLCYSEVRLGSESFVQMTSLLDGSFQVLDARSMEEWRFTSAYFNGSRVLVELVSAPHSRHDSIAMTALLAGVPSFAPPPDAHFTVCNPDDDRAPSMDAAVARLSTGVLGDDTSYDAGCTGFIVDAPTDHADKVHLSAGHCFVAGVKGFRMSTIAEFMDVRSETSNPNCTVVHPDPTKQFAIDRVSAVNGGLGNDWAVFTCFRNPVTLKTTFEEQGVAMRMAAFVPTSGTVRLTGYGFDGNADAVSGNQAACECNPALGTGTRNEIQQSLEGPIVAALPGVIAHRVDTCGGNSGSPLALADTGEVIGIHTHGACAGAGTSNFGTEITLPALQAAIATSAAHVTTGVAYCFGDAVDSLVTAECPCLNFGEKGRGCANSNGELGGARLFATGTTSPNTVLLTCEGLNNQTLCTFLRSSASNAGGAVFGDGVLCVGAGIVRFGQQLAGEGGNPPHSASSTARSQPAGATSHYQCLYRNGSVPFCAPALFNVSNAYQIHW